MTNAAIRPNMGTMACDQGEIEFGYRWVRTLCGVFARSGICLACNRFHSDLSWHGTFGLSLPLLVPFTRKGLYRRVVLEQTSGEGCSAIRLRLERVWDVFVLTRNSL